MQVLWNHGNHGKGFALNFSCFALSRFGVSSLGSECLRTGIFFLFSQWTEAGGMENLPKMGTLHKWNLTRTRQAWNCDRGDSVWKLGKVLHQEGGLEQAPWGCGHSTDPSRVQEAFGKCPQTYSLIFGWSCEEKGADGSFPTQDILCDNPYFLLTCWLDQKRSNPLNFGAYSIEHSGNYR